MCSCAYCTGTDSLATTDVFPKNVAEMVGAVGCNYARHSISNSTVTYAFDVLYIPPDGYFYRVEGRRGSTSAIVPFDEESDDGQEDEGNENDGDEPPAESGDDDEENIDRRRPSSYPSSFSTPPPTFSAIDADDDESHQTWPLSQSPSKQPIMTPSPTLLQTSTYPSSFSPTSTFLPPKQTMDLVLISIVLSFSLGSITASALCCCLYYVWHDYIRASRIGEVMRPNPAQYSPLLTAPVSSDREIEMVEGNPGNNPSVPSMTPSDTPSKEV